MGVDELEAIGFLKLQDGFMTKGNFNIDVL